MAVSGIHRINCNVRGKDEKKTSQSCQHYSATISANRSGHCFLSSLEKENSAVISLFRIWIKKKINSQELSPFLYLPTHLISLSAMEEGYLICLNVCVHRDLQRGNLNPTCLVYSFLKHSSSQHVSFRSTHLSISLNTNLEHCTILSRH